MVYWAEEARPLSPDSPFCSTSTISWKTVDVGLSEARRAMLFATMLALMARPEE